MAGQTKRARLVDGATLDGCRPGCPVCPLCRIGRPLLAVGDRCPTGCYEVLYPPMRRRRAG